MTNSLTLLPAQIEFVHPPSKDTKVDVVCYQGGFGSGKTLSGVVRGNLLSQLYRGNRGLVCAKTWPLLRDTTLQTYFEFFDKFNYREGRDYTWKVSEQKITFPQWGSEILFRHLEHPDKLKSLNLGWIHVEEMSMVEEAIFLLLISRLRLENIPFYTLFGTTNPQSNKGWIHARFVEGAGTRDGICYRRIIAPSTENIYLPQSNLDNMKQQFDPDYYRINVLGEDGDYTSGLVCKTWSPANIEETPYRDNLRLYLTCDFNVDPMCWYIVHRFNNEYHFVDELCIENTNIIKTAEEFVSRYHAHKSDIIITGDATGKNRNAMSANPQDTYYKTLMNTLSQMGMTRFSLDIRESNPIIEKRVIAWNSMICNFEGVRRVKVNPKCKWLIYNMENLKYIPGTSIIYVPTPKQIQTDNKLKFIEHPFAAASYIVERYDPVVDEVAQKRAKNKVITTPFRPSR